MSPLGDLDVLGFELPAATVEEELESFKVPSDCHKSVVLTSHSLTSIQETWRADVAGVGVGPRSRALAGASGSEHPGGCPRLLPRLRKGREEEPFLRKSNQLISC